MTNGEKLKELFPDIQIFNVVENEQQEKFIHIRLEDVCQAIELKWWNAEYKEPTTKNNLADEYISREALMVILSDYYDTTVEYRSMLKEIASLPVVTPQEPFINKPCVSSGVCEHDKNEVLDKIRAEIEEYKSRQLTLAIGVADLEEGKQITLEYVLAIIDKYKAESEDT